MKLFLQTIVVAMLVMCSRGELRTWTHGSDTYSAEYVKILFDDVILKDVQGEELRFPLKEMSDADRSCVELCNPPKMKVEFRESAQQVHIAASPYNGALPPIVLDYQFGASVRQLDTKSYNHAMRFEIYAFSQQRYDPDKYHLISKLESDPFKLTDANRHRFVFDNPKRFRLIKYDLDVSYLAWSEPRGEKISERLVLVRDERGDIIAYNTTKNWLYENMNNLEKLPVGAWLNRKCIRVHPTSPKDIKSGEPPH